MKLNQKKDSVLLQLKMHGNQTQNVVNCNIVGKHVGQIMEHVVLNLVIVQTLLYVLHLTVKKLDVVFMKDAVLVKLYVNQHAKSTAR